MAHLYITALIDDTTKRDEEKNQLDSKLEEAFKRVIMTTTKELMGEG